MWRSCTAGCVGQEVPVKVFYQPSETTIPVRPDPTPTHWLTQGFVGFVHCIRHDLSFHSNFCFLFHKSQIIPDHWPPSFSCRLLVSWSNKSDSTQWYRPVSACVNTEPLLTWVSFTRRMSPHCALACELGVYNSKCVCDENTAVPPVKSLLFLAVVGVGLINIRQQKQSPNLCVRSRSHGLSS